MSDRHHGLCATTDPDGRCRAGMGSVVVHVADRGEFFATRDSAARLAGHIEAIPRGIAVIVDWRGVVAVTGAFASEYAAWYMGVARRIGNDGMSDDVRREFDVACRRLTALPRGDTPLTLRHNRTQCEYSCVMTVNPRLQIRLTDQDPLAAWLDSRSERMATGSRSKQALYELALWHSSLDLELRRIRLTVPQARCIADVCNTWMLDTTTGVSIGLVYAECDDAFRLAREAPGGISSYGAQHGIDEKELLDYLARLSPVADHALRDAIARWWQDDGREDSVEGFARVGLRVTDTDTAETAGGPS